jgi:cytochrome c oxidase subunit 2
LTSTTLLLAGCQGLQAPLNPAGTQARHISGVWWLYFAVSVAVYLIVVALATAVVLRNRRRRPRTARPDVPDDPPTLSPEPQGERRAGLAVAVGIGITTVILFVLMLSDFFSGRAIHLMSNSPDPVTIRIVAHQWWWEAQYGQDNQSRPHDNFTTSNEIHIPVGRPVQVLLSSSDVIHSFWVPNLSGKKDMIPGHQASLWLNADREGTYFGQCAEFCGFQHAQMRLVVVAESPEKFEAWQNSQRQTAAEPQTDRQRRGQQVFLGGTCAFCHTIEGTMARSRVGPDLTHVASRAKLAAGSLPNTTGHLAGWILDPQQIKPGVRMPPNPLKPDDLHALLDYLSILK